MIAGQHPPYAILGPCPCQGCGLLVYWSRSVTRLQGKTIPGWMAWRERTGRVHRCAAKAAA